jgi:hypothetical protein
MRRSLAFFLLLLAASPCLAQPIDRANYLVKAFTSLCSGPLDFAQISDRAKVMGLKPRDEKGIPGTNSAHMKSWYLPGNASQEELSVVKIGGTVVPLTSCNATALDINANDFKVKLMKAEKLDEPKTELSEDGKHRVMQWKYKNHTQLLLVDSTPQKQPGFMLSLSPASAAK